MNEDLVRLSGTMPVDLVVNLRTGTIERVILGDEHFELGDAPALSDEFRPVDSERDAAARSIALDPSLEWPTVEMS